MCVLPTVFHKESVDLLCNRHFDGGLLNATAEDRTFGVGLQERMEDMTDITFAALDVAVSTRILTISEQDLSVIIGPVSAKSFRGNGDSGKIIQTARRLGYWFATRSLVETCSLLRISF